MSGLTRGERETRLLVQGDGRQSGAYDETPSECASCRGGIVRREVGRIEVVLAPCSSRYARGGGCHSGGLVANGPEEVLISGGTK